MQSQALALPSSFATHAVGVESWVSEVTVVWGHLVVLYVAVHLQGTTHSEDTVQMPFANAKAPMEGVLQEG